MWRDLLFFFFLSSLFCFTCEPGGRPNGAASKKDSRPAQHKRLRTCSLMIQEQKNQAHPSCWLPLFIIWNLVLLMLTDST